MFEHLVEATSLSACLSALSACPHRQADTHRQARDFRYYAIADTISIQRLE